MWHTSMQPGQEFARAAAQRTPRPPHQPTLCLQIVSPCHCGKLSKPVRCSQAHFSCSKLCGKHLPCGHRCPHKCHSDPCPECTLTATVRCHCGAETQTLPCSQRDLHCDRVCGKGLACGRHSCERVCHEGSCGGCPMEGPRLCPCGKVGCQLCISRVTSPDHSVARVPSPLDLSNLQLVTKRKSQALQLLVWWFKAC